MTISRCRIPCESPFPQPERTACKFSAALKPASRGFELSLQIGYGLAADGPCKPNSFPKDKLALAWLSGISESNLPGWMFVFEFILRRQAKMPY